MGARSANQGYQPRRTSLLPLTLRKRSKYDEGMALTEVRILAALLSLGAGIWTGGVVTVILVVVSSRGLVPSDRVAMFRHFGRRFAIFFGITALVVVVPATVLAVIVATPLTISIAVLTTVLLVATALGIAQARRMTTLRTAVEAGTVDASTLRRNALLATVIRTLLVGGYVALLALAVVLAGTS